MGEGSSILMPSLDWTKFNDLQGERSRNFENLCRGLMKLHYGRFGEFRALANQPGIEFHIKLTHSCQLGELPRWYGWQCKYHTRTKKNDLTAASRRDIESSLRKTEEILPEMTDWVLWTPFTLSKKDQEWFTALSTKYALHLWTDLEIDTYLSGDGLILRSTYFDELILTPHNLAGNHSKSIQPIKDRWLESIHQAVDAERIVRRMLGETDSWGQLVKIGERLSEVKGVILSHQDSVAPRLQSLFSLFIETCSAFVKTLIDFQKVLAQGDLDIIQQRLKERKTLLNLEVRSVPRRLRSANHRAALYATNALDDMFLAQDLLDEVEEFLAVGLVAILADAGGGKTQMAAQLSAQQKHRPAGVLLHGRNLHKGQSLDDLAHTFVINGIPVPSMESLLAAVDAAGKRASCRLPILIDGLNEAENPKDWKSILAVLSETVKHFPNVLVVCTLRTGERKRNAQRWHQDFHAENRESFAVMALPDEIKTIDSEGFGGDADEAVEKYFDEFKINPGDTEIPIGFLSHPLNLRIFCEVTNFKKEKEVKVDYFPTSLSPLFEKYIAKATDRILDMENLSYSYRAAEMNSIIYTLGAELWNSGKREIDERKFRQSVDDLGHLWDSSIVNLFSQEGLIFRNPASVPGQYIITPIYDALGGYLVANALLLKHSSDFSFSWINEPDVLELLVGEESHELAFDILRSLVTLAPSRMQGRHLWKYIDASLREKAIVFASEIDAEYIDQDTIIAITELLDQSYDIRNRLFLRLFSTRAIENHSLNANFLTSMLLAMSVAERDLIWTEWLRSTRSDRLSDLLALERKWKRSLTGRTLSDQLCMKWVMWHLTSTDKELRDIATRTLYWFGRGDPTALFEESLAALNFNDPYVPERMLAASYGVAMARHVDFESSTFVDEILPKFARSIYELLFIENAPYKTTHYLLREYGSRLVELTSFHDASLFSPIELERSHSPFDIENVQEWGESRPPERRYGEKSPFRMDFENYTLGSLVSGRGNYDFENEEYLKVRAQVLWRVEQLGWSSEKFKDVDSSIENQKRWPRVGSEAEKTDRYGKKYSWIAFFELSGKLRDEGKTDAFYEYGWSWDCDIDPSFPEQPSEFQLIREEFLSDSDAETGQWVKHGLPPNVSPYLRLPEIRNLSGPWVLLDGYIAQENKKTSRSLFCFIRSFLVSPCNKKSLIEHLSKQDLGNRWLPEKPIANHSFAGEIPWCSTFPEDMATQLKFITDEEIIQVGQLEKVYFLNGVRTSLSEYDVKKLQEKYSGLLEEDEQLDLSEEDFKNLEMRELPAEEEKVWQHSTTYHTLIPVCDFSWEGKDSAANSTRHGRTLAKPLIDVLELRSQPQTFDLYSDQGLQATLGLLAQSNDSGNDQSFLYLREDLLRDLLEENDLSLVWAVWGERQHSTSFPNNSWAVYSFIESYD